MVRFSADELASIATPLVTVSMIVNGYQPLTIAGLEKPTDANPKAMMPFLAPIAGDAFAALELEVVGGSSNALTRIGAVSPDLVPETLPQDRRIDLPTSALDVPDQTLGIVAATEEVPGGSGNLRFTASTPYALESASGGTATPGRALDFTDQPTYREDDSALELIVDFDNDAVSGDPSTPGDPGPLGLLGAETDQFRRLHLLAAPPGFSQLLAIDTQIGASFAGFGDAGDSSRSGAVALPVGFATNDSVDTTGVEDSALELLLQPSRIDPEADVDDAALRALLRLELTVEDVLNPLDSSPSAAATRQRLRLDDTLIAAPQAVPALTVADPVHPPILEWTEPTSATNAVHRVFVSESVSGRLWQIVVPASGSDPVSFSLPAIAGDFVDVDPVGGSAPVPFEFSDPGTYGVFLESFDFEPLSGSAVYTFDVDAFFQTDLEREWVFFSRSDPFATITTS